MSPSLLAPPSSMHTHNLPLLPLLLLLSLLPLLRAQEVVFLDSPSLPERVYLLPATFSPPFPTAPTSFTLQTPLPSNPYACPPPSPPLPPLPTTTLLLVHRGSPPAPSPPCTFLDKALTTSLSHASLMLVIDYPNATSPTLMSGSPPSPSPSPSPPPPISSPPSPPTPPASSSSPSPPTQ